MSELLCTAPRCRVPGRHRAECVEDKCKGCLPARAGDGIGLCWYHRDHIGTDAERAAVLFDDCELALSATGAGGERPSGTQPGLNLNVKAAAARHAIHANLARIAHLVAVERIIALPGSWRLDRLPPGVQGPPNRRFVVNRGNHGLALFISTHANWLAAQPFAGAVSATLSAMVRLGHSAAYPVGTRIIHIAPCPVEVDGGPCPGKTRALLGSDDSLLPASIICDHDSTHTWRPDEWRTLGRKLGIVQSGYMTALEISISYRRPVASIYRLASVDKWRRTAEGLRPVRYDWRDVDKTMKRVDA